MNIGLHRNSVFNFFFSFFAHIIFFYMGIKRYVFIYDIFSYFVAYVNCLSINFSKAYIVYRTSLFFYIFCFGLKFREFINFKIAIINFSKKLKGLINGFCFRNNNFFENFIPTIQILVLFAYLGFDKKF